jgi:hypothetical protein
MLSLSSVITSRSSRVLAATAILVLTVTATHAAGTPEQKCQAGKNKAAGKYAYCRAKAEAKLATSGDQTKYGETIVKCYDKQGATWQKLEDKAVAAGTTCPSVGDAADFDYRISLSTLIAAALLGGTRFVDNGDGTVTDLQTGLQWEQKTTAVGSGVNLADPHDVDNTYSLTVSGSPYPPDGTA